MVKCIWAKLGFTKSKQVIDFLCVFVSSINCGTSRKLLCGSLVQHFPVLFEYGVLFSTDTSNLLGTFRAILSDTPSEKSIPQPRPLFLYPSHSFVMRPVLLFFKKNFSFLFFYVNILEGKRQWFTINRYVSPIIKTIRVQNVIYLQIFIEFQKFLKNGIA